VPLCAAPVVFLERRALTIQGFAGAAIGIGVWIGAMIAIEYWLRRHDLEDVSKLLRVGAIVFTALESVAAAFAPPLVLLVYVPAMDLVPSALTAGLGPESFIGWLVVSLAGGVSALLASVFLGVLAVRPGMR